MDSKILNKQNKINKFLKLNFKLKNMIFFYLLLFQRISTSIYFNKKITEALKKNKFIQKLKDFCKVIDVLNIYREKNIHYYKRLKIFYYEELKDEHK